MSGSAAGSLGTLRLVRFEGRAMASPLRLTVALEGDATAHAETAWDEVRAEFEAAEAALSRFRASSELTAANRTAGSGIMLRVSRRLETALAAADRARRLTGGQFDARVLGALERLGDRGVPLPPAALAGRPGDGRTVHRRPLGTIALDSPVDLGGIGKGLALRWAAARVRRVLGDVGFLLEAGGDLVAGGAPPAEPWRIGIEDPAGGVPLAVVAIRDGAIATSSVRIRRWEAADGRVTHHLIDPVTREPGGAGLAAVTVAAPDPAWAEVRSKTLFLDGAARIAPRARELGLAAWWVSDEGGLEMTPAARTRTIWTAGDRP